MLEPRAHDDATLLDVGGHPPNENAVLVQPVEGPFDAGNVRPVMSSAHVLHIVAEGTDNIPRRMGLRRRYPRPIEQVMLQPAQKPAWLPLGALLVRESLISNEQLELALIDQQGTGLRLGELLVQWGWVESAAISRKRPLADRQRLVEAAIRRKARTEMIRAVRSGLRAFQRVRKRPW